MDRLLSMFPLRAGLMKRAQRGLFGGKRIMFGNTISHSEKKTRRTWKPNVQSIKLYSELLATNIRFNMTPYVLRIVDKMGGLDRYLLYTPDTKIDSEVGTKIKKLLADAFQKKHGKPFDYRDKTLIKPLGTYVRPQTTSVDNANDSISTTQPTTPTTHT